VTLGITRVRLVDGGRLTWSVMPDRSFVSPGARLDRGPSRLVVTFLLRTLRRAPL